MYWGQKTLGGHNSSHAVNKGDSFHGRKSQEDNDNCELSRHARCKYNKVYRTNKSPPCSQLQGGAQTAIEVTEVEFEKMDCRGDCTGQDAHFGMKGNICDINIQSMDHERTTLCSGAAKVSSVGFRDIVGHLHVGTDGILAINTGDGEYKLNQRTYHSQGSLGKIYYLTFTNGKQDLVIMEKVAKRGRQLEEVILLESTPELETMCQQCIPIKQIGQNIYMPVGNDMSKLRLDADTAGAVVACVQQTIGKLLENDINYFDIKPENLIYDCCNGNLCVWLIDLGSMVPLTNKQGEDLGYPASYFHPIYNHLEQGQVGYQADYEKSPYNEEEIDEVYEYMLMVLFFRLIIGPPQAGKAVPMFPDGNSIRAMLSFNHFKLLQHYETVRSHLLTEYTTFQHNQHFVHYMGILTDLNMDLRLLITEGTKGGAGD